MQKKIYRSFLFVSLAFLIISYASAKESEIRYISPPKLEEAHLGKRILCHRPMRHGSPAMEVTHKNGKYIISNYGHGGSGWTLAPGSAIYVVDLFEKSADKGLTKNSKITVVGAGVIGLFTAYELVQRGYKNIEIISEQMEDLVSHNAGGLLAPVSMSNDSKMAAMISKIGIDAYRFYEKVAKSQHKDFNTGAVIVPTYFKTREDSGLEPYVNVVMEPAKDVIIDFGNGTRQELVVYDNGIFIDTAVFMVTLTKYLKAKGIKFKKQKVSVFDKINTNYIFNCAGIGAKDLVNDDKLVSVQGHLIMLKNQNPRDLQHMILVYFDEDTTKSGFKVKRSFYMFPKRLANSSANDVGVIGGTFIEGATPNSPNQEEFDIMLRNARKFYGITN